MDYILAYSPIFNPIELVFSKLKSAFKKMDHLDMEAYITKSIEIKNQKFNNYIRKSTKLLFACKKNNYRLCQ